MLKDIRKDAELTQKQLAEESGVCLRQIIMWEKRGVEHGVVGKVKAVADVLGCRIDDLLSED